MGSSSSSRSSSSSSSSSKSSSAAAVVIGLFTGARIVMLQPYYKWTVVGIHTPVFTGDGKLYFGAQTMPHNMGTHSRVLWFIKSCFIWPKLK